MARIDSINPEIDTPAGYSFTERQTDRDTLIAILCYPIKGAVTITSHRC